MDIDNQQSKLKLIQYKKRVYVFIIIILFVSLMFCFYGCSEKLVDFYPGKWQTKDVYVGKTFINNIELEIDEHNNNSKNNIEVDGQKYEVVLIVNEDRYDDLGLTYYSKKLRVTFVMGENEVFISANMKQGCNTTYIDASLTIKPTNSSFSEQINTESVSITMEKV